MATIGPNSGKNAQLVHPPERAFGIAMLEQQIKEDTHRFGVAAHLVIDQLEMGRDRAHRIGMQQVACAQRLFEQAQHVELVGKEGRFVAQADAVLLDDIAGL